jgi:hypothetical protein
LLSNPSLSSHERSRIHAAVKMPDIQSDGYGNEEACLPK